MEWANTTAEERILDWKEFRDTLKSVDFLDGCQKVSIYLSNLPFGAKTIDYFNVNEWPDPWTILANSQFCKNTISLMMYYTLRLAYENNSVDVVLVDDDGDKYLAVLIDSDKIMNRDFNQLTPLAEATALKILAIFDRTHIKQLR